MSLLGFFKRSVSLQMMEHPGPSVLVKRVASKWIWVGGIEDIGGKLC